MKPRNKFEKAIAAYKLLMPRIPRERIIRNFETRIGYRARKLKSGMTCMACGHSFQSDAMAEDVVICPHCHNRLTVNGNRALSYSDYDYLTYTHAGQDTQVVRKFAIKYTLSVKNRPSFTIFEVERYWYGTNGKFAYENTGTLPFSYGWNACPWVNNGQISFKNHQYTGVSIDDAYVMSIHPYFRKRGIDARTMHAIGYGSIFLKIQQHAVETLVKNGGLGMWMLKKKIHKIEKYFPQYKIAVRHGYDCGEHADLWCDYIDLLEYFRMDTHNPKFVCPADLKAEHDRLLVKKEKALDEEARKMNIEKLEAEIRKEKVWVQKYPKVKGKYFGLSFKSSIGFVIEPLKSFEEFFHTGNVQHNCVFTNRYFAKDESLILNAKMDDAILATIEVDLQTYSVVQCRGKHNNTAPYNAEIRKCVAAHMKEIARIA